MLINCKKCFGSFNSLSPLASCTCWYVFYSPSIHISVKTVELHKNNAVTVRIYCFSMWCIHFYFRSDHRLTFPSSVQFHLVFLITLCIFCAFFIRNWFCCIRFGFLSIILMESDFFRHRQVLHRQHSTVRMSI